MSGNVFIDPLDLAAFGNPAPGDSPGFAQLVQDVLGSSASALDGFDAALADAAALVDALDAATGEQDAALDAILVTLDTANPAQLDTSMAGYVGTADQGAAIVAQGATLGPPNLLELPLNPDNAGGNAAPPVLKSHDFGDVKLGSPMRTFKLGVEIWKASGGSSGLVSVQLVNFDQPEWGIDEVSTYLFNGDQHNTYTLQFTPAVLGPTTAQVNTSGGFGFPFTILTFTANVVP